MGWTIKYALICYITADLQAKYQFDYIEIKHNIKSNILFRDKLSIIC